jgi:broad-specificity NMP kinase
MIIHINGYPGTGKLTIALALHKRDFGDVDENSIRI